MEPAHAFEGRLPRALQDEAPHVVETEEGHEVWVLEGTPYFQSGLQAVAGRAWRDWQFEEWPSAHPDQAVMAKRLADVPDDEAWKITHENEAKPYRHPLPKSPCRHLSPTPAVHAPSLYGHPDAKPSGGRFTPFAPWSFLLPITAIATPRGDCMDPMNVPFSESGRRALIASFDDAATAALFHGAPARDTRRIPSTIVRVAMRKLDMLNAARSIDDLRCPPGNRLEMLRGDLRELFSIRINDQWRLVFRWDDGDAHEVRIVEYHP